jgi:FMN-dependent NADH-azoreductase
VPMWNGGIPYRLKLYIDIMTQPGLLFGFDPAKGYSGLLKDKRATVIYTSGVYAPGVPAAFGIDHHSTYFDDWLRFIGITDITTVRFQPTLLTADYDGGLKAALNAAAEAAKKA